MRPGRLDHHRIALHQLGHWRRPLPLDFGTQLGRIHTLDTLLFLAKLDSQQSLALGLLLPPLALLGNLLVERLADVKPAATPRLHPPQTPISTP